MQNAQIPRSQPSMAPQPRDCGNYNMRITADGLWHHNGTPIRRPALVRLFAGLLKRDAAGDYWLETPAERGRIQVYDAPFVAVDMTVVGTGAAQRLTFRTNLDHQVTADAAHPIRLRQGFDSARGAARPYLLLDDRIEALIARSVYYRLADLAVERRIAGAATFGVWSGGVFFALAPAGDVAETSGIAP